MIIHMGWIGSEPPPAVLAAVDAVRKTAADCEVMFHVGDAVIPEPTRSRSAALIPHMRSDIQRHAALKQYGGLWLDADVRLIASPTTWASEWDRYTVVRFGNLVATDIIYVPQGWDGWPLIDAHIDRTLAGIETTRRVKLLALAMRMVEACQRQRPEAFAILEPGTLFPFSVDGFTTAAVVARGFDPPADPPEPPSFLVKAKNFAAAAVQHVAAGMPLASDAERERRFTICQECEHYDGTACRKCGCGVSRERAYVSKLSWATSSCPVGKWGPDAT